MEVCSYVGGGGACVAAVGVSGVNACYGVSKVPFYPCQRCVPEPVIADSLSKLVTGDVTIRGGEQAAEVAAAALGVFTGGCPFTHYRRSRSETVSDLR